MLKITEHLGLGDIVQTRLVNARWRTVAGSTLGNTLVTFKSVKDVQDFTRLFPRTRLPLPLFTRFCLKPKAAEVSKLPSMLKKLPPSATHVTIRNLVLNPFHTPVLQALAALPVPQFRELQVVLHYPDEDYHGALEMSLKITQWLSIRGEFLQELQINEIQESDDEIEVVITLPNLPSLEILTLGTMASFEFYPFASDQFPRLNKLDLSWFHNSFSLFSSGVFPTLKELIINIPVTEEHLPWEVMFPNVEVLDLSEGEESGSSTQVGFKFKKLVQFPIPWREIG